MSTARRLNLHQVAETLELDPVRLYRLGRHLHLAPGDPCIPHEVVERARAEGDGEVRYRLILDWLLESARENTPTGPNRLT